MSWLIAFVEYCFQVPANRWGSAQFSPVQLKMMQEIITLVVFSVFAVLNLDTKLGWNHAVAVLLHRRCGVLREEGCPGGRCRIN